MSFDDIAIHDGRMARVELLGNLIICFDTDQVIDPFFYHREAIGFQVSAPIATAASGGRFEDGDYTRLIYHSQGVFIGRLPTSRQGDEQ